MPTILSLLWKKAYEDASGGMFDKIPRRVPDLPELRKTQRSDEWEKGCLLRRCIGGMRYGFLKEKGKPQYDRIDDAIRRLRLFQKTRNAEHLMDAANNLMLEFVEGEDVVKPQATGEHTNEA